MQENKMGSTPNSRAGVRHVWRCGTVLALGLGLGMLAEHSLNSRTSVTQTDSAGLISLPSSGPSGSVQPWGELEVIEFPLELSDEFLTRVSPFQPGPKWCFPGRTLTQVTNLFRACGVTESETALLLEGAEWELIVPGPAEHLPADVPLKDLVTVGVWASPPPSMVLNLNPAARQRIYAVLAASDLNPGQRYPLRFNPAEFDARVSRAGLSAGQRAIVKQLAYADGDMVCLADLEALRHVFSANELRSLLQSLCQTPTLLLRVAVSPHADVEALVRYWGRGNRARTIKPFLDGLAQTPGRTSVSVSFFMPPFARTRLYTFPDAATNAPEARLDSLWTALNFFNDQPDDLLLCEDYAEQVLRSEYQTTQSAPAYGDLVALVTASGNLVHLSVYIADGVVFTRNGVGTLQPWVLMKIPDMVTTFSSLGPLQPVIYQRHS